MKCRHPVTYLLTTRWRDAIINGHHMPSSVVPIGVNVCGLCMEDFGVGPANDTGEHASAVALEKDALINWVPLAPFGIDYDECCCPGCQKRWLADCIVEPGE